MKPPQKIHEALIILIESFSLRFNDITAALLPLTATNTLQNILGSYTAVGILEHWDLSMQLFDAKVKSPVTNWQDITKSNPGTMSESRAELYRWAHMSPAIHSVLTTDMLLYSYALSVFKVQTTASLGTVWE